MEQNGKLSQAEIDALLNNSATPSPTDPSQGLSDSDKDVLGEVGNISFGSAATVLSTLLQQRVEITTPTVSLITADDVPKEFARPYVMVSVEYTAGLVGSNALAIEMRDAKTIADLMLGGDGTAIEGELNEMHLSAVGEAMNQMMGGAATALSSMFKRHINISPPKVAVVDFSSSGEFDVGIPGRIVNISFRLRVGSLIDSTIMQLTPFQFAKDVVRMFTEQMFPSSRDVPGSGVEPLQPAAEQSVDPARAAAALEEAAAAAEATVSSGPASEVAAKQPVPGYPASTHPAVVQRPEFVDFSTGPASPASPRNLSLLYDVAMNVTVELGRTKRAIREILDLVPGSIVELDKLAGEPVDILVNNKRIAVGEVVVIDENFGVRVTDILDPNARIRNLEQ